MYYKQISSCFKNGRFVLRLPTPFLLLCLCIFPIPRIFGESTEESTNPSSSSLFSRFWEIGCEFSGVVTRVRRSASPIPDEEPNFEDPEELFKYLYPLADMKPGEEDGGNVGGQRSHDTHSLSSWLENLMGLWHSECHNHRRNKRSAKRMVPMGGRRKDGVRRKPQEPTPRHRSNYLSSSFSGRNASLAISSRQGTDDDGSDIEVGYGENKDNDSTDEEEEVQEINQEDVDEDDESDITSNSNSTLRLKPKPDKPKPPVKEDIFFTQYGGDIEYFFPLLSFGIPFDGEITLLGFHGFRGLFPY